MITVDVVLGGCNGILRHWLNRLFINSGRLQRFGRLVLFDGRTTHVAEIPVPSVRSMR